MPHGTVVIDGNPAAPNESEFVWAVNNEGDALPPGVVTEWSLTTTDADQGSLVELVDTAVNLTTGLSGPIAGVVEATISTGDSGRLQVYGAATVRASASIAAGSYVVASSINATNKGHVTTATTSTAFGPAYQAACIGWTLENGPNATQARVFLEIR
jgi:hypothetical protein